MSTGIGNLNVGNQQIEQLAALGLPDHLFVEQLAAAGPQYIDDACPMIEVVPEEFGIEQLQLVFFIACQFTQPPIVKQQPSVFVDHAQSGRAVFKDLAKLPFLLGDLRLVLCQRGDVIDPEHAFGAGEADLAALVGHLHIRQQQVKQSAGLAPPGHLLIEQLTTVFAQRFDDARALFDVVPECTRFDAFEFVLAVAEQFAQPRVVKQQAALLIDDQDCSRAEFQHLAELAFLLGGRGAGRAFATGHAASGAVVACCGVRRHRPHRIVQRG